MTVLVTGGAGFIGREIVKQFLKIFLPICTLVVIILTLFYSAEINSEKAIKFTIYLNAVPIF